MNYELTEEQTQIQRLARESNKKLNPRRSKWMRTTNSPTTYGKNGDLGMAGMLIPEEYGSPTLIQLPHLGPGGSEGLQHFRYLASPRTSCKYLY